MNNTTTHDITSFIFEQFVQQVGTEILKSELKGGNPDYEEALQKTVLLVHAILGQVELYMHLQNLQRLSTETDLSLH